MKIWSFASNDIMCHISASNRIWAFKFFVGVGGGWGWPPHMCACTYVHVHARWTCMAANRKETKEFQISVYFVQIKAKIIKYGFKHTECRLVYVYIMVINFIVDLEMPGMDEVMFRPPPTPSNFLLRCCAVNFFLGDSVLYKVSKYIRFFAF